MHYEPFLLDWQFCVIVQTESVFTYRAGSHTGTRFTAPSSSRILHYTSENRILVGIYIFMNMTSVILFRFNVHYLRIRSEKLALGTISRKRKV